MAKRGGRSGRKYVRDSIGRFATTGATARGGRLKTKSGKKRATQTVKAKTGGKPSGAIKGKIKRDPGAAKPAAAKTKLKRSGEKIGVGRLTTNKEQGRKGIVSMSSQAKAARKGAVAERKSEKMSRIAERQSEIVARRQGRRASNYNPDGTFNQSTANANQRRLGRSKQLQEKLRYAGGGKNIASKALSKRRKAKPAAAKPAAAKPAAAKRKSKKVSADKVSRIADRLNKVSTTTGGRQGVKALNRIEVAGRAKRFLSRKAGGVSGLNSSGASRADKIKSVQSSINTRIKYSTQKPNRNKPGRFNDLGQSSLRAKNKIAAQTPRQKIAAAKPVKTKPSDRLLGRRELLSRNPVPAPNTVRASGTKSTVKRSKAPKKSSLVVRTRQQSKAAQKFRRESILFRTRNTGATGLGSTTPNARVRRQRTGTQLSLLGKAAPLYKFRPVKRRRS